jgi:aminoglycoside phosphotransferase family enzyme
MTPSHESTLQFLRSPQAHAAAAAAADGRMLPVDAIETHMSWVFLVGDQALKLKKPVRSPVLDFSTPTAREAQCREEVRLNSRLAPGVYHGLMALLWHDGRFWLMPEAQLTDRRDVVDWLVWMRRLPAERMLDRAIAAGWVQPTDIDALVAVLAAFYRSATPVAPDPDASLAQFRHEHAINRALLLQPQLRVDGAADALERFAQALQRHRPLLRRRSTDMRIVDGHGDLRPEHVCLLAVPVVIDCLEFNASLRQVDPFDELSFLALECALAGAPWIGPRLIEGVATALGDAPPTALLQLYTASRALLRARLSAAHLLDARPRTPQRWLPQAQRYVAAAAAALDALDRPDGGLSAARRRDCP